MPLGFLCLNKGSNRPHDEVVKECVKLVRDQIGPVADFKRAVVVDRLPKTRSGKILRGTMVKIADGQAWKMPATVKPRVRGSARDTDGPVGIDHHVGPHPLARQRHGHRAIREPGGVEIRSPPDHVHEVEMHPGRESTG